MMCKHTNHSASARFALAAIGLAMLTTVSSAALAANHTGDKATSKSMPSMDHSKMGDMKMDHSKMGDMKMDHSKMGAMKMDGMSKTGDMDYDFAANMRMHHQMAVDMSEAQLKNGKDAQMGRLAKGIITAQKKEIAVLDKWMQAHKTSAPMGMPKAK